MTEVRLPEGFALEPLRKDHPRAAFRSGQTPVDEWLTTKALQHQDKHLSVTKALIDDQRAIAGFYTLATSQVDFGDLPIEIMHKLPKRALPVAVLAWLGVAKTRQNQGLGSRLFAQALRDCHTAGQTFAFIAVVIDCLDDRAKTFYQRWDFLELPGHPYRLAISAKRLEALITVPVPG